MPFSWNELVGLGIIKHLLDPEVVIYFMRILKPMRRDHLDDESRASYLGWEDQNTIPEWCSHSFSLRHGRIDIE